MRACRRTQANAMRESSLPNFIHLMVFYYSQEPDLTQAGLSTSSIPTRLSGRAASELRPVVIETGYTRHAEGSVLIKAGDTHVLCNASVLEKVPPFLKGKSQGWVTAEYGMRSEEHTSELQSLMRNSYAVFCL